MNKMLENIENQGTMLSLEYFDASKNKSSPWGVYCVIIRHCCTNSLTLCGDEGMKEYIKEIADSLQANTMLDSFTLLGVGKIGMESIKEVLINNVSLKRLNLSSGMSNSFKSLSPMSDDMPLGKFFRCDQSYVAINVSVLYDNNDVVISHSRYFPLSDRNICTQANSVIELSGEKISDNAVHVLAFGLCNNTTVEELNISYNRLTDEGVVAIIDCLHHNKTLKKLDLSCNKITGNGMNKILDNIRNQRTTLSLKYVDLSKNQSSPWCVYCAIIRYSCVNSVTLCGDEGMREYISEILHSLQVNMTLQSLTLNDIAENELHLFKSSMSSLFIKNKNENSGKLRYLSLSVSSSSKSTVNINVSCSDCDQLSNS